MTDGCPIGKGCKYASGAKYKDAPQYCMYCVIEKRRRPCPPGAGCTVRVEGARPRSELPPRKAYGKPAPTHPGAGGRPGAGSQSRPSGRKRSWDTEKAAQLFLSGMRAKDVANAVGVKYATPQYWMRGNTELKEAMRMNAEKKDFSKKPVKVPEQQAQAKPARETPAEPVRAPEEAHGQAPVRKQFLDEAERCICHDREETHGAPEDNFAAIAALWEAYLRKKCVAPGADVTILPEDVGLLMALFKVGRMMTGTFHRDNYVDAIGYLACAGELAESREGENHA